MINYPPNGVNKSGVACWWSITRLIETYESYFWTLTCPDTPPDYVYGIRHGNLLTKLKNDARAGLCPPLCGVRVVEEHPGGHGLHYHWVVAGRFPIRRLLARAKQCGFGRVHVDEHPCTPAVAPYLAAYLRKNDRLFGVRMWANMGSWGGVGTRDIEMDSNSCRVFRDAYRHAVSLGKPRGVAFNYAKIEQRNYYLTEDNETAYKPVKGVTWDSETGRVVYPESHYEDATTQI